MSNRQYMMQTDTSSPDEALSMSYLTGPAKCSRRDMAGLHHRACGDQLPLTTCCTYLSKAACTAAAAFCTAASAVASSLSTSKAAELLPLTTAGAYTATAMGKGHERHRLSSKCSRPAEAVSIMVTALRGRGSRL